jgi:uncharacterized protein (TIGR02145 family)
LFRYVDPNFDEISELDETVGKKLKSKSGWKLGFPFFGFVKSWKFIQLVIAGNGTDEFGFAALPGNHEEIGDNYYRDGFGISGSWWSASEYEENRNKAYSISMYYRSNGVGYGMDLKDNILLSIRCLQN